MKNESEFSKKISVVTSPQISRQDYVKIFAEVIESYTAALPSIVPDVSISVQNFPPVSVQKFPV